MSARKPRKAPARKLATKESSAPEPAPDDQGERYLTPREAAAIFSVDPKTVSRWAATGKLTAIRTLGGHRRFPESEVREKARRLMEPASE